MNPRLVVTSVLGAMVVYVASAACSASSGESAVDAGALADALTNPVREAQAGPQAPTTPTPDVATESCDKTYQVGTITLVYAEHAYPGRRVEDLARVVALGHLVNPGGPPGSTHAQASAFVREGVAFVSCGSSAAKSFDTVTFVLP